MAWVDAALLVAAAVATLLLTWAVWRQGKVMRDFSLALQRDAAQLVELRYQEKLHCRMEEAQRSTEQLVDCSTSTVRVVHEGVAKVSFGLLESIPATRETAKIVRHTHDLIAEAVYGSIRDVNKTVGNVTRRAIDISTRKDGRLSD